MWELSNEGYNPIYLEVIKRSDNFYGVYKSWFNYAINGYKRELLTSATAKNQAHKKAKIIRMGIRWVMMMDIVKIEVDKQAVMEARKV